jgi:uncharacterized protein
MKTAREVWAGPAGDIEVAIDWPQASDPALRGVALVAHPHPLFGGTLDNKVAQTLAKTFVGLGYLTVRPNFRGVGLSAGTHDEGRGETDDLLQVLARAKALLATHLAGADTPASDTHAPLENAHGKGVSGASSEIILAGFSFGSLVQSRVALRLREAGSPATRLVFAGTAVTRGKVEDVPADTIIIHGELDEVVPLKLVLDWALPQDLPITVLPGANHFFDRRLHTLKSVILAAWR